jgi:biotin-(acetyl-CoA carboxylase) ligase
MVLHGSKHLKAGAIVPCSMLLVVDRVESSPQQTLSICTSLAMQAVHGKGHSIAWINHLMVGGWCLCGILVVGERLE